MPSPIRIALTLALAIVVLITSSPASFADRKGNSNSSSSDDKKDKDKDRDKDKNRDSRGSSRQSRDSQKSDSNKSNSNSQPSKSQQGNSDRESSSDKHQDKHQDKSDKQSSVSDKQNKSSNSNSSTNVIIGKGPQSNVPQKILTTPNAPKQYSNSQKPNTFPPNMQPPSNKDKWPDKNDNKNDKAKWQYQSHKDHKEMNKWVDNFGGPKPFSSKWYKDHPKAWHHHHDHDDNWKYVTAGGLIGFLGWQGYHSHGPVVVYQPVPYDNLFVNRPGVVIDVNRGDWRPLGVYSLMVSPGDESTRMLDLVVDRFGNIRGSYYDMISDNSYNVAGIIDQRTQYAQFSLESNRQLTFYTPIGEMLQPLGYVNVQLPSGQRQQWQLVRMEDAGY